MHVEFCDCMHLLLIYYCLFCIELGRLKLDFRYPLYEVVIGSQLGSLTYTVDCWVLIVDRHSTSCC